MMRSSDLDTFLAAHPRTIVAELTSVRGSSPRAQGTFMVIAPDALLGRLWWARRRRLAGYRAHTRHSGSAPSCGAAGAGGTAIGEPATELPPRPTTIQAGGGAVINVRPGAVDS